MSDKKYFWLKLKRDFFKRHDIQIIESMPNGKDYVLFYLKLLVESVDHEGELRFNEVLPYNENMLSTITNTDIDITRSALKLLEQLNMIETLEDDTIFMTGIEKMLGTETYWAEQKRKQRNKKELECGNCPPDVQDVQVLSNQELDIDKELDKDKKKNIKDFFDYWNTLNIIKHKTLTDELKGNIKKGLSLFSLEELKTSADHYSIMLHDASYEFCNYKWGIHEFLTRVEGYKRFMEDGSKWVNYHSNKVEKKSKFADYK